jgi:RNase H-fold protein (predicted Holliday junction resolvase)
VRVDERFSTYEAARALQAIPKARRNKGAHDIASAVIILQTYLLRIRR